MTKDSTEDGGGEVHGGERGHWNAIYLSYWDDPKALRLSPRARMLFAYLRTSPDCGVIGIFPLDLLTVREHTGLTRLPALLDELEREGWIKRERRWCWIVRAFYWTPPVSIKNPKQRKAAENALANLPPLNIVAAFRNFYGLNTGSLPSMPSSIGSAIGPSMGWSTRSKEKEKEKREVDVDVEEETHTHTYAANASASVDGDDLLRDDDEKSISETVAIPGAEKREKRQPRFFDVVQDNAGHLALHRQKNGEIRIQVCPRCSSNGVTIAQNGKGEALLTPFCGCTREQVLESLACDFSDLYPTTVEDFHGFGGE